VSSWPRVMLGAVCEKPQYGAIAKGSIEPIGPRFVRQTDIVSGRIDWNSVPFCDLLSSDFKKYAIHPGDILISRLGNGVGNAATVREAEGAVFAGYLVRFQARALEADPAFIGYQLQSNAWKEHVVGFRSGAAQPTLNAQQMSEFQFLLPSIEEQRGIAATLSALDDKIESNRLVIDLIEAIGDALFSEAHSTTLKLSEVASLTMGSSPPGSSYNEEGEGMPFYQGVRDFKRRYPGLRVWTNAPVRVAKSDDTLISVRAPVGDLNRAFEGCCIGRGVAAVHSDWPSTIYYSLRAASDLWEPFQQEGTVFGAINRADLAAANVPWPATSQLVNLEVGLVALDNQIRLLTSEKDRLVQLRDTLLPELLSGRIRVTEAHEAVT
jgi:type I restriction enzyme S subunit